MCVFALPLSADSSCQHRVNWTGVMTGQTLTWTAQGHAEWLRGIWPQVAVKQGLMKQLLTYTQPAAPQYSYNTSTFSAIGEAYCTQELCSSLANRQAIKVTKTVFIFIYKCRGSSL